MIAPTEYARNALRLLEALRYEASDVVQDYRFTQPVDGELRDQSADFVAFGSRHHSLSNACLTVFHATSASDRDSQLSAARYLTTPAAILLTDSRAELFPVRREVVDRPIAWLVLNELESRIGEWQRLAGKAALVEARRGEGQLLFADLGLSAWAEMVTERTLVGLLEDLVRKAQSVSTQTEGKAAARVVFHLFACRVLEDKRLINSGDVYSVARQAHEQFINGIDIHLLDHAAGDRGLIEYIWKQLTTRFSFSSISPSLLGHAYEQAFTTPALRRKFGIFYTPRTLARYALSRIPLEAIPAPKRVILDPCCGSGSFLLAALERLRAISVLEGDGVVSRQSIVGSDTDEFGREIAALSLALADVEHKNGWPILSVDALSLSAGDLPSEPTVIVTNPPFREEKGKGERTQKAAVILRGIVELLPEGGHLAIVLPQSFLDAGSVRSAREHLLNNVQIDELDMLPSGVFDSKIETVLAIGRKRRGLGSHRTLSLVREVRQRDVHDFLAKGTFSHTYGQDSSDWDRDGRRMVTTPFAGLWRRLEEQFQPISAYAELRNGIQVRPDDRTSVQAFGSPGTVPYVERTSGLRPYAVITDSWRGVRGLRYGEQLHRPRKREDYQREKVVINATRNPSSSWRIVAAYAEAGVYFSDRFHIVLPKSEAIPIDFVLCILNSVVANAWFDAKCRSRKVVLKDLTRLPFPLPEPVLAAPIVELAKKLKRALSSRGGGRSQRGDLSDCAVEKVVFELDHAVFAAYGLLGREREEVRRFMLSQRRPSVVDWVAHGE